MITKLEDLVPDPANANEGTLRGEQLLERSVEQFGAGRAIVVDKHGVVIGGNKTLQMAIEAGLGVRVVQSDGTRLVVVVRTDLDLNESDARLLAYFDNRTAELGLKWNPAQLEADLAKGIELGGMFTEGERRALLAALVETQQPVSLLKTTLAFETPAQRTQWQATVARITKDYPGDTFPDKLELWLDDQMTKLDAEMEVTGDD